MTDVPAAGSGGGVIPASIRPMLAESTRPFDSDDFQFEVKWDGVRCIAFVGAHGRAVHLQSRNLLNLDSHYPDLLDLGNQVEGTPCVLDGEIIALRDGRPSFLELQKRMNARGASLARVMGQVAVLYVAFDMLYAHGRDVMERPLEERQSLLGGLARPGGRLLLSEPVRARGQAMYAAACQQKLEGVMAKRLGSLYYPGKRSDAWLKIKRTRYQPFVVCGCYFRPAAPGEISSVYLGALHEGELRGFGFAGSGLSGRDRDYLSALLADLGTPGPPGSDFPTAGRAVRWMKPQIVCLVEYLELTEARTLRHPTFRGFCRDISLQDCRFDEEGLFDPDGRCRR